MKMLNKSFLFLLIFPLLITSCSGKKENRQEELKKQQYMIMGKQLYIQHCSACHQPEGEGLARLYPPINKSDFMDDNLEMVTCMIKYGMEEPLTVNGITYTQPMPGLSKLTNLEVAEILTYIYNSWEHEKGLINVTEVDRILNSCESHMVK